MTADDLPETVRRDLEAIDAALGGEPVAPELTEIGALALALREERPRPEAVFTRELDARAAAGFPRRRRAPKAVAPGRRRAFSLLAVPSVLVGGLAAIAVMIFVLSAGGTGTSGDGGGGGAGGGSSAATAPAGAESGGDAAREAAPARAGPRPRRSAASGAVRDQARTQSGGADSVAAIPPASGGSPAADGSSKRI